MISEKEKAREIVIKMQFQKEPLMFEQAKQCALIAVDEILDLNLGFSNCDENNWAIEKFYIEVKQEIQKL
jgi:hypothetical protein